MVRARLVISDMLQSIGDNPLNSGSLLYPRSIHIKWKRCLPVSTRLIDLRVDLDVEMPVMACRISEYSSVEIGFVQTFAEAS